MSMELTLEWEPNQSKKLVVDEFISVPELKQMCCCEAASAPMYTRVMFGDQTLLGNQDKLANEYGITNGSVLKLVVSGLK